MPYTSAQPEGEAKMSGIFSPSWDKIIPFSHRFSPHCFSPLPPFPNLKFGTNFRALSAKVMPKISPSASPRFQTGFD